MRFSYAEALCDPTHYLPLAHAVEEAKKIEDLRRYAGDVIAAVR